MKRSQVVKSKIEFNDIIKNGMRNQNKYFVICSTKKEELNPKFGLAVGTKIGNAVTRNKIKRQLRNIIDNNYKLFKKYNNYIIICKKEVLNLSYKDMEKEIKLLIEKSVKNEK